MSRFHSLHTTDLNFYNLVSTLDHCQRNAETNLLTSQDINTAANLYVHFRQYADSCVVKAIGGYSFPRQKYPSICTILTYTGTGCTVARAPAPVVPGGRA